MSRLPSQTLTQWLNSLHEHLKADDIARLRIELEKECYVFGASPANAAAYARAYCGAVNITPPEFAWIASLPLSVQAPDLQDVD